MTVICHQFTQALGRWRETFGTGALRCSVQHCHLVVLG